MRVAILGPPVRPPQTTPLWHYREEYLYYIRARTDIKAEKHHRLMVFIHRSFIIPYIPRDLRVVEGQLMVTLSVGIAALHAAGVASSCLLHVYSCYPVVTSLEISDCGFVYFRFHNCLCKIITQQLLIFHMWVKKHSVANFMFSL